LPCHLDPHALKCLHDIQKLNPERTLGSLVSEAVWDWWENLPDDDSDMDAGFEGTSSPDLEQDIEA
jgi:hypothetical protein